MWGPKAICEECSREYQQAKVWQRFCQPHCRDEWHNRQRKIALAAVSGSRTTKEEQEAAMKLLPTMKKADIPDTPHPWRKSFKPKSERKPLSEIMETLKERAEPQAQPQPPISFRRSFGA